ncbi:MAG: ABC transporter substrate-binding protein [Chloroflexota bacterium]
MLRFVSLLIGGVLAFALPAMPGVATAHGLPIRIGAVFPLKSIGSLAKEEYRGVEIARQLTNTTGGIQGRRVVLVERELDRPGQASRVMASLERQHLPAVLGAYSSALSVPAARAAAERGMVYWEAGAVADRLTGEGLPLVFRVGADGSDLGANSANFVATQLAPRLHEQPRRLRISIVQADDGYAASVVSGVDRQARAHHLRIVSRSLYNPYAPYWAPVLATVRKAHPDILILASHIPDGVSFRRAFLQAHLHVGAFIGSTMAQCMPNFGRMLGKEAVGVFASDRPEGGFNAGALKPAARTLYNRFARIWKEQTGESHPSEEALAGFSAAWVLFHDVLPKAAQSGKVSAASVALAARSLNLPAGSLTNGAGVRFSSGKRLLGQNLRAAAIIWQWQAVRHSVVVWPAQFATGRIRMVPLPR